MEIGISASRISRSRSSSSSSSSSISPSLYSNIEKCEIIKFPCLVFNMIFFFYVYIILFFFNLNRKSLFFVCNRPFFWLYYLEKRVDPSIDRSVWVKVGTEFGERC